MNGDLLKGVSAIAGYLGLSERQVYRMLSSKALPAFQLGGLWYARQSTLARYFGELEQGRIQMRVK